MTTWPCQVGVLCALLFEGGSFSAHTFHDQGSCAKKKAGYFDQTFMLPLAQKHTCSFDKCAVDSAQAFCALELNEAHMKTKNRVVGEQRARESASEESKHTPHSVPGCL